MLANDLKLVTKDIAAEVFSVSVKTIDNYIKDGLLPPPRRFVSKEYWHPDDFRDFVDRTFRTSSHLESAVDAPTEVPPDTTTGPEPLGAQRNSRGRSKDTSPLVRERVRRQDLLERLNGPA